MRRILFCTLSMFFAISARAQESELAQKTLFSVEDNEVTAGEFMQVYNKNRSIGEDIDPKTPREYLQLYINFKLKVQQAKEMGMDTLPKFINEFNTYRDQLAQPYLSDRALTDELVREAYDRSLYDIRASHIMIAADPNADAIDTLKAYKRLESYKKRIEKGESFESLAEQYSMDTYSAKNGGDLGYFTAFSMVYPFESAAYSTPVGELSKIVRTQYGFHLIKVTDKRPARGLVQVAHILILANDKKTEAEQTQAKKKIDEIYAKLKAGASFEDMARQFSDDKSSAYVGGLLPEFGINKMMPSFEDVAFGLKEEGDISAPFKTSVGWHIVKLIDKPEQGKFEEQKADLKRKVERDSRSQQGRISIIKKLKKEYKFKEYPKNIQLAFAQVGKDYLDMQYDSEGYVNGDKVIFTFADESYTVGSFLEWLELNQAKGGRKLATLDVELEKAYDRYSEGMLLAYEKSLLEEKYPEFAMISREYFEGILLFDLTDQRVWRKSITDSTGLKDYFEANRDKYKWGKRVRAVKISAQSEKIAKKAAKMLKKGKSIAAIRAELNAKSQLSIQLDSALLEVASDSVLMSFELPANGLSEVREVENGRVKAVYVYETLEPALKTLAEARGQVLTDFTAQLERDWLAELAEKYEVEVQEDVMLKVEAELES